MTLPLISIVLAHVALGLGVLALLKSAEVRQWIESSNNDLRRRLANHEQRAEQAQDYQRRALARMASGKPMTSEMLLEERLWEDLDGEQAAQRVAAGALALDVRTEPETRSGMIPGALHIPLNALESRISELPRHKALLIYCAAGVRSAEACEFLSREGFDEISNLAAGFPSWPQQGTPTP